MKELEVALGSTFAEMECNWYAALPHLTTIMVEEGLFQLPQCCDNYLNTKLVLEHLHRLKIFFKKINESDRKCRILEVFPENTPLAETWSKNRDPPRLMAIQNGDGGSLTFYCFVDIAPLFAVQNPVQALCLLLSSFYAFNICWTPKAKLPLQLLVCATAGPRTIAPKVANNAKFVALLRRLNIDV